MRGILFILKGNHPELATAETKAAMHGWGFWKDKREPVDSLLFFNNKRKVPKNLGLTHRVIKVCWTCSPEKTVETLKKVRWKFKGTYRVSLTKLTHHPLMEREVADIIWHTINRPKVSLDNPDNIIDVLISKNRTYVGIRKWEDDEKWVSRRADNWPMMHPSAMHPTVARAMMNLACATRVHDPFCGAGGFLLEGAHAGITVSGADIDPHMILRARKNTRYYRVKPELRIVDAIEWLPRVKAMVTDLPYGKNTKNADISALLESFLINAHSKTNRIVLGIHTKLPKQDLWNVRFHSSTYVHKNMTRHFYVLEAK